MWLTGKTLNCTHNISEDGSISRDICGLNVEPDYISMTCSIAYRGREAPTLLWRQNNVDLSHHVTSNVEYNSRVTSSVIFEANKRLRKTQLMCLMKMLTNNSGFSMSQLSDISWTSPVINLLCMLNIICTIIKY